MQTRHVVEDACPRCPFGHDLHVTDSSASTRAIAWATSVAQSGATLGAEPTPPSGQAREQVIAVVAVDDQFADAGESRGTRDAGDQAGEAIGGLSPWPSVPTALNPTQPVNAQVPARVLT